MSLSLEEELSLGEAEGREEYMFSLIRSISVDENERIYVLDFEESHIKIFDRDGKYIQTVGKKGQGPGEMSAPSGMLISKQNEIVMHDRANRRLNFYSLEGNFIKSLSTADIFLVSFNMDSKGNIIGCLIKREKKKRFFRLCKFDSDFNFLFTYSSFPHPYNGQTSNPFEPTLCWAVNKDDDIIFGYPDKKYEFKAFNSEGNEKKVIKKKYNPLKISKEVINEIKETAKGIPGRIKFEIPKYYPRYGWFILDDEDRIFVQTWKDAENGRGYYYDVFDSEGRYIAKIQLKFFPEVIKKGKLYTVEKDEEGYQCVKRYKITWKI
jgi:hypothetical protein